MAREKVNKFVDEATGPVDRNGLVAMPRPPRLQFEGALYHVYTRGNHREVTFRDEADYREFESTLIDLCHRMDIHLYAWCLMPNHFHLLPETPNANLGAFMQRLLSRYMHYFNRRYKLTGHLFQGRYQAILCERETYLLELVRYIHLNPYRVKNRRWKVPEGGWPWSSHRYYLDGNEPIAVKPWIHAVLRRYGDDLREARGRYDVFVAEGLAGGRWEDFYQLKDKVFLGSDRFVQEHQGSGDDLGALRLKAQRRTLEELAQAACEIFSILESEIRSRSRARHASRARQALCLVARKLEIASTSELARYLQRDPSVISHLLGSVERSEESAPVKVLIERMTSPVVSCGQ